MKNHLKILILDDEILALSYLRDIIEDVTKIIPEYQNCSISSTSNQNEFWQTIEQDTPQIIFLDIQMPKKSGLDIAKEIREKYIELGYRSSFLPLIIFTTAHENYGYMAYKVNAIDYILKPIDEEKINSVLTKILQTYQYILKPIEEKITIHSVGIDIDIPIHDVLYFKADMKYISVVTKKKEFLINDTLLNLEEKYPNFVRIHRAYLVNPAYVSRFYKKENHWYLILKEHDVHLPISRRQKPEIEKKIDYKNIFND